MASHPAAAPLQSLTFVYRSALVALPHFHKLLTPALSLIWAFRLSSATLKVCYGVSCQKLANVLNVLCRYVTCDVSVKHHLQNNTFMYNRKILKNKCAAKIYKLETKISTYLTKTPHKHWDLSTCPVTFPLRAMQTSPCPPSITAFREC